MTTHAAVLGMVLLASAAFGYPAVAQVPKHDCDYCHNLHGGSYAALTARDLQVNLCQWCHDPDAAVGVDFIDGKQIPRKGRNQADTTGFSDHISGTVGVGCWDCHNHEGESVLASGDTNLVLVSAQLTTPNSGTLPVTFRNWSTDLSFADTIVGTSLDGTYRICEVCHTGTTRYTNTDTSEPSRTERKNHYGRADCTLCHTHDTGFEGAGACTTCHSSVQDKDPGAAGSRRAVVSEFSLTSHHANAVQDRDCEVCHDLSQHQQGQVRLKNADNGGVVYTLLSYTDPSTNATEAAKLTPFCLSCHDSNAAGGANPFSDGATPPVIDNNAWTSSSHNTAGAITGCFGDGAFGCHATGHGSEKIDLLAPAGTPATAPANIEQEEGFCFNCHDSDGPSTSDIEGLFSTAVRWVTAAVGDNSNVNLNDRHDVQHAVQTTSGAKLECTDCHNPHTAKSTAGDTLELLRPDPDPTDGRTPTNVSEWCLDCHDGSFPSTVTAPTTALNDVRTSNLTDAMGAGGGNATLKAGYGWAADDNIPCYACHVPHVVNSTTKNNLFHLVEVVKSKNGTTDIPSDNVGLNYEVTDNSVKSAPVNGYEWCNTCHTASMGDKKDNCYACHYHGTRW